MEAFHLQATRLNMASTYHQAQPRGMLGDKKDACLASSSDSDSSDVGWKSLGPTENTQPDLMIPESSGGS